MFVNTGILGMQTFSNYIREAMASDPAVEATHINLSEHLTMEERLIRRVLCARLWDDHLFPVKNLDFARLRAEWHMGLQAARRIRKARAHHEFDVVHFHRQTTAFASLPMMRKVPSIVSIDATQDLMLEASQSALERWTYRPSVAIEGRVLGAAAAIVSTSDWAAGHVRRRYPELRTPIHVMPSPVRLQFFDESWAEERLGRAGSRPDYRPRVLFVGGDFVRKGGEDLLAVWRGEEMHRHAHLDLVTNAPLRDAAPQGVRVIRGVTSYSAEWLELWHAADVFVLPTREDAFANVFQEAAAAGLPRIGTRSHATPEMIIDGESGLLVAPADRLALAGALRRLIESPALRRDLGQAARARVIRSSSPDGYRDKLRAVIQNAATAKATGANLKSKI